MDRALTKAIEAATVIGCGSGWGVVRAGGAGLCAAYAAAATGLWGRRALHMLFVMLPCPSVGIARKRYAPSE